MGVGLDGGLELKPAGVELNNNGEATKMKLWFFLERKLEFGSQI